ncbi:MAG: hypothetical protein O2894_07095 [Planctomycetota bacterium]|nr:hypothetical protein [Planctomycetota bacterium]
MSRPCYPHHLLGYVLSLPERVLRYGLMLVGLVAKSLLWLLPGPIREGRFYRLAVERQIKILTDDVGRAGAFKGAQEVDGEAATRMAVGGAVDNLVMVGLHASPMWILLAAADVSKGARAYVHELGAELKRAGVMAAGSRLDSVEDVLGGLERLSTRLSDTVDMPPLSVGAMKETLLGVTREMREGGDALRRTADVDALASDLTELARQANHSLLETTGAIALGSLQGAGRIVRGSIVGAEATVRFFTRVVWSDVLGDYGRSMQKIYRRGFYGGVRGFLRPQAKSGRALFAYDLLSWTETALSFGHWRAAPWATPERR